VGRGDVKEDRKKTGGGMRGRQKGVGRKTGVQWEKDNRTMDETQQDDGRKIEVTEDRRKPGRRRKDDGRKTGG
jgi:hypothetical protein